VPRSDNPAPAAGAAVEIVPSGTSSPAGNSGAAAQPDPNELKPSAATANPNELRPNVPAEGAQALPSPQQVNEIQTGTQAAGGGSTQATGSSSTAASSSSSSEQGADDATVSSSKKKKKKGLAKLNPF
jgi:outer membrane protein assembly factor BamD